MRARVSPLTSAVRMYDAKILGFDRFSRQGSCERALGGGNVASLAVLNPVSPAESREGHTYGVVLFSEEAPRGPIRENHVARFVHDGEADAHIIKNGLDKTRRMGAQ